MKNRILICDDDEVLGSMIQFKLTKEKLGSITRVTNGKDAKEAIEANDFSLIISDINMPFVSGIELLDHLRKEKQKDTAFILLSAEEPESTVTEAFDDRTDFLIKPFTPGDLSVRAKTLLAA